MDPVLTQSPSLIETAPLTKAASLKKTRSSNFELLRIVCMILIIAYHYCVHGNHNTIFKSEICVNQVISVILGSWGLLGVNCFVFISAYFLLGSHHFSVKKIIRILLQTTFYSTIIAILLFATKTVHISKQDMLESVLSPIYNQYWFVTAYCLLYAVFPFLNAIVYGIPSKCLAKFLFLLTMFIPLYRTFITDAPIDEFLFFIYLYLIMGYLKRCPENWFELHAIKGFILTTVSIIAYQLLASFLGSYYDINLLIKHANLFSTRFSPLMVLDAVFLFYLFKNIKIKNSKLINTLAQTALGIYLIHENPLAKKLLWDKILRIKDVYYYDTYIIYFVLSVIILFVIAAVIELIRINLIEKPIFSIKIVFIEHVFQKIDAFMNGS